jgi:hypothetical protein
MESREQTLKKLAKEYVWWQPPEKTLANKNDFIAQILNLGTWEDTQIMIGLFSENEIKHALKNHSPGIITEQSWHYWHIKLLHCHPEKVPPLPKRKIPT